MVETKTVVWESVAESGYRGEWSSAVKKLGGREGQIEILNKYAKPFLQRIFRLEESPKGFSFRLFFTRVFFYSILTQQQTHLK